MTAAPSLWKRTGCPVCGGRNLTPFFEQDRVPVRDGVLFDTRRAAETAPTGAIRLTMCGGCLYIGNECYEPRKVRLNRYDFSLQDSPTYRRFVDSVALYLKKRVALGGTRVLDVGCGDALFLKRLCAVAGCEGTGIEPAFKPTVSDDDPVTIVRERFSARQAARTDFSLVACRHVLSEVDAPARLLRAIGNSTARDIYLEVPNAAHTLTRGLFWNLVYEHRSWFLPEALANLCGTVGLHATDTRSWLKGEYLSMLATPSPESRRAFSADPHGAAAWLKRLASFRRDFERVVERWQTELEGWRRRGLRVVAWGAGARAITFCATIDADQIIDTVVDINPRRWGKYLPRSAARVASPEFVRKARPDVVLITNPTYAAEIQAQVRRLGVRPRFACL